MDEDGGDVPFHALCGFCRGRCNWCLRGSAVAPHDAAPADLPARLVAVRPPDVLDGHEDGRIIGAAHRGEDARHAVGAAVFLPVPFVRPWMPRKVLPTVRPVRRAVSLPMTASPGAAKALLRHGEPGPAGPVRFVFKERRLGADDAEAPVVVAEGWRDHQIGAAALPEGLHVAIGDIADGMVPEKDRIDHQLIGRALRPHEDGERLHRPVQPVVEAGGHLEQKDRQGARRRQQEEQQHMPRRAAQDGQKSQTEDHEASAPFMRRICAGNRACTAGSWVAQRRVHPLSRW